MNSQFIDRYIRFHATEAIIAKGVELYRDNKATLVELDEDKDFAEYQVQGGQNYRVHIKGVKSGNILNSCTCPFDWNILCKHAVAALLHLKEIHSYSPAAESKVIIPRKRTEASMPLPIPQWRSLNRQVLGIGETFMNFKIDAVLPRTKPEIIDYSETHLVISIESANYFYQKRNKVTFELSDGKVYSRSDEIYKGKGFSLSEIFCLLWLIKSSNSDILAYFFDGKFEQFRNGLNLEFDLEDDENFMDYFKPVFEDNNLVFVTHKKGLGLVSPNLTDYRLNGLSFLKNAQHSIPTKSIFRLGFMISKRSEISDSFPLTIKAIIGQPGKIKSDLFSNLNYHENISSNQSCPLTDGQTRLLSLIKELNASNFSVRFDLFELANSKNAELITGELSKMQELQNRLNLIQSIFKLLADEKQVYIYNDSGSFGTIKKKSLEKVQISEQPLSINIQVNRSPKSLTAQPCFLMDGNLIPISDFSESSMGFFNARIQNTIYAYDTINTCLYISNFRVPVKTSHKHLDFFINELIEPLSQQFNIDVANEVAPKQDHILTAEELQLYIGEENDFLRFDPMVVYSNGHSVLLFNRGNKIEMQDNELVQYIRDDDYETNFIEFLASLHPEFDKQKNNRFFYLPLDNLMQDMWFYGFYEQLQKKNVKVFGLGELKKFRYSPFKASVTTQIKSGQDWFELDIQVKFGDYRIKIADLKKAVMNQQLYIQLHNGTVGVLPEEWLEKFQKYFRNARLKDEKLQISKLRFNIIDQLYENIDNEQVLREIADKRQRLKTVGEIADVQVPKGIKAQLRDYQKEGLQWLSFLDGLKWGGILADDMGLGKTLQILAFLKLKLQKTSPAALVVVPTTLLFNWENEVAKFAPSLKVLFYHGNDRVKSTREFNNYHMIITTYGVLNRDIELLKDYQFSYAILDESQAIKNPGSNRYKAAVLLNARNRFAITGTPIENSTFDLYAQMNFANPGFFGDIKHFKEDYSNKIDKEGDEVVGQELAKLSKPFILRRTKELVAKELPDKTEEVIYCEMEPEQRKVYEAYRNEYRDKILDKIEDEGIEKSKLYILEGLLRLRQICDSPLLLKQQSVTTGQSAKIKELLRLILEKTANHKLLIFSQFVSMLHLIRSELVKHHIPFEYLDGQSSPRQRKESVEHFQESELIRVFLVSLKAGGTGLNLTSADYVILVDPWWNPAVEAQAIDRSHRIGQDKKVIAYRMICTNTIEDKIINLQRKKMKIASDIIQNDQNIIKSLKTEDIRELFS